ncbi:DUF4382 domain-containing protein [Halobaculum marinum]|uniref:DUF4382 domain-containing protein n=1 Tax=Halobaculum marinum TaxID=3031996 RepID=A0ABD5WZ43_9EURY|nr:DUF4382 domain-containing protein [Halobaculum sp. DT55]
MTGHTTTLAAVAAALMLVLAGCGSGVSPGTGSAGPGAATGDGAGSVNFYISDQQNAIDQFEHLNVTVDRVELVRAGEADASETDDEVEATDANETEADDEEDGGERVAYEMANVTVDLTELQGANSTKIGNLSVPNGTYSQVVVHVESVNGTLTNGESAAVKLPSEKLRLNKGFTVGDGESVDFVFDITVTERGNNGYILKPVAGESGTSDEVDIEEVDDLSEDADDEDADDGDAEEAEDGEDASESESAENESDDASENAADGNGNAADAEQSSMDFYLSDEQHAMGDFAHLNVTVTEVGLREENGSWVEHDVENRSVDLTTLPGANATKLGTFGVEDGTYTKVFVHVDEIDATLENGESTTVKLPSNKLQLNSEFTVGNGEDVDFVYDMSVFEAGNSGKYILKPVVSESGTGDQVPIVDVDEDAEDEDADDDEREEAELTAAFDGNVTTGESVTVVVTENGSAVENATVTVDQTLADDETTETTEAYETGANGTITFLVDANATELTVTVVDGDAEAELEREFQGDAAADEAADDTEDASLHAAI